MISIRMFTVQKGQRLRFIPLMQRENILYMTNSESIALFLADFYALSTSVSLECAISSVMHIPAYSM
jgi:hypothetical protein